MSALLEIGGTTIINGATSINNTLTSSTTAYLWRFTGSITPPSTLNTGLTGATDISNITIDASSNVSAIIPDPTLSQNTTYTYAFYNGDGNSVAIILTDVNDNPIYAEVTTGGSVNPVTSDIYATTTKNTPVSITLAATDPQGLPITGWGWSSPTYGVLSGSAPNFTYTPNIGYIGSDTFTYSATDSSGNVSNSSNVNITINDVDALCFKEGTKILCLNSNTLEEVYIPIQNIRKGTLVKTLSQHYYKVNAIGKSKIYNSGDDERTKDRLYVCSKDEYPELTEDLVITGCHSILVDRLTSKQREKTIELMDRVFVTENRYRLMACIDERAHPYPNEGTFNIWHLALDHDDYFMNYGIYANGLVVESCSRKNLFELSHMTLM